MSARLSTQEPPRAPGAVTPEALKRRWPLVLYVAVLTALAVMGVAAAGGPPAYTSVTTVLVNPLQGSPFGTDGRGANLDNLQTEAELVRSDLVAERARRALGTSADTAALVGQLTVENPPNSQVLRIGFTDATAEAARAGARAFASAFLDFREARALEQSQNRIDALSTSVQANEEARAEAAAAAARAPAGSAQQQLALQRVETATAALAALESQISDLRLQQTDPGTVLSPAPLPERPAGVPLPLLGLAGLVLGLGLGLALAAARAYGDRRLHSVGDVEAWGYTVLGVVPASDGTASLEELLSSEADVPEGVRVLQTVLAVHVPDSDHRVLCLAPVDDRSVRPLAAQLAVTMVRSERRVVLVDADLRRAEQTLGPPSRSTELTLARPGLSAALGDDVPAGKAGHVPQAGLLWVPPGTPRRDTVDLMSSPRMADLLHELSAQSEWLLLSCGTAGTPETSALTAIARRVVLVARLGSTTSPALDAAVEDLERCGAELVGVVLEEDGSRRRRWLTWSSRRRSRRTSGHPAHADARELPRRAQTTADLPVVVER